jgi:hypothetical protein
MKKRVTTPNTATPPVPHVTPPVAPAPEGVLVKIKRPHIDLAYTTGEEVHLPEALYAHYTALALATGTDPYFEKL